MKHLKNILEQKEQYFYHATYRVHKNSIEKHGLRANSDHKNWQDSEKGKVYLAKSPEVAQSYAETSEEAPEEHYNSGIVVYKIPKSKLNAKNIHNDSNVIGGSDTVEYHGDIKPEHLSIHSEHDT